MATIATIAKDYKSTPDEVLKIARRLGIVPFTIDWELTPEQAGMIISKLPRPIHVTPDPNEKQIRLLSSKFIIFTLTAMEKPGTALILKQILEINGSNSRLIVVSAAIDELKKDAEADTYRSYLMDNYRLFDTMRKRNWLIILDGAVAEEGLVIGHYIRTKIKPDDSVLVLGKNMSLNTCIYLRNNSNMQRSSEGKMKYRKGYIPIEERGISKRGFLQLVNRPDDPVFGPVKGDRFKVIDKQKYKVEIRTTPYEEKKIPLRVTIPSVGENAFASRNGEWVPVKLESKINSGGAEGGIYAIDNDELCAKIFKPESITERKMVKLGILCEKYEYLRGRDNSVIRRIGWPQEMLYNSAHEPIGYIMRKFKNVIGFDSINARKYAGFIENKKEKQIIAAVSLTELIRFLHDNNVILCDINRGNILFDNNQRAYLVDLDSAQITDPKPVTISGDKAIFYCFPANVAVPQFLSPERIDETTYTFIHSKEDDIWILQYMIFLLITSCGAFFPYKNDATSVEGKSDIKNGYYQYFYDYKSTNRIANDSPLFMMHCIISRLSPEIQKALYNSFSGKGKQFRESDRYEAKVWMLWLVKYYYDLPKMIAEDSENGVYMPSSIKYISDVRQKQAKLSGNGLSDFLDNFDELLKSFK
jgi:hypothetical protein